jgi:dimeric dUTPase (all-alpha-NTP-PPase superfamily)
VDLNDLLKLQKELDDYILKNKFGNAAEIKHIDLLTERLLALQVEVSELANATRSFKYWSEKGPEPSVRLLDEFADCLHFLLSIGHTLNFSAEEIEMAYLNKHQENYKRQKQNY